MTARWWSQPFAPEGSTSAEGIEKQLGKPSLDPLTVLVREAAQNSWDACTDHHPDFTLDLSRLGNRAPRWRDLLLPGPDPRSTLGLADHLHPDTVLLTISDRHTVGLGGPLRAGQRPAPGQRSDFVQFVRNIGEPNDVHLGGGTYGFGKGIYFRVSRASTIIVDTRTTEHGPARRRLIGSALSPSWFDDHDHRHTGRHWWGSVHDDVPDPIVDVDAATTARDLGLPGFDDELSGTDIALIDPDLGTTPDGADRSIDDAAQFLASSLLWHLWPKMVPDPTGNRMSFIVRVDGQPVPLPEPAGVTDLAGYVRALQRVRGGDSDRYTRTVAPRHAGDLALEIDPASGEPPTPVVAAARPYDGTAHHVARMRSAELVVDYLEVTPHPNPRLQHVGTFRASGEADSHFAAAEPPTHDGWIEIGLTGTDRGVVQRARTFIQRQVETALNATVRAPGESTAGLGNLSLRLGSVLEHPPTPATSTGPSTGTEVGPNGDAPAVGNGLHSQGSGPDSGSTGDSRRGSRTAGAPRLLTTPTVSFDGDRPRVRARVHIAAADTDRAVIAEPDVIIDGTRERTPPAGAPRAHVIGWSPTDPADTELATDGAVLRLPPGDDTEWWVDMNHLDDAVIALRVRTYEGRHRAR